MKGLYKSHKIEYLYGRPIHKVEVIEENSKEVTFETDYPVKKITCPSDEFYQRFAKW